MVLITILLLTLLLLIVILVGAVSALGAIGIVIFGDVIVCAVFIILLVKFIYKKKRKKN